MKDPLPSFASGPPASRARQRGSRADAQELICVAWERGKVEASQGDISKAKTSHLPLRELRPPREPLPKIRPHPLLSSFVFVLLLLVSFVGTAILLRERPVRGGEGGGRKAGEKPRFTLARALELPIHLHLHSFTSCRLRPRSSPSGRGGPGPGPGGRHEQAGALRGLRAAGGRQEVRAPPRRARGRGPAEGAAAVRAPCGPGCSRSSARRTPSSAGRPDLYPLGAAANGGSRNRPGAERTQPPFPFPAPAPAPVHGPGTEPSASDSGVHPRGAVPSPRQGHLDRLPVHHSRARRSAGPRRALTPAPRPTSAVDGDPAG